MGHQDTGKHNIHNGGMVGYKNVRFTFVFFLVGKMGEVISQTHAVKHSETPDTDKFVSVFVMFFIKG